jgi:hypothetical protein
MRSKTLTRRLAPAALVALIAVAGCASGGSGSRDAGGDRDLLTFEELQQYDGWDLLAAIESLRPQWLRVRPTRLPTGQAELQVVVDGQRRGGVDFMRSIRVAQVRQVHYLSAADATTRMGTDMAGGAILVTMRMR